MKADETLTFRIGGISLRVWGGSNDYEPIWGQESLFITNEDIAPHLDLHIRESPDLQLPPRAELAFDARPLWTAHRRGRQLWLCLWHGKKLARMAELSRDSAEGVLYVPFTSNGDSPVQRALQYPMLLLLTAWQIARAGGLLLHACGLIWRGAGVAMCGRSNSGKTTTSRLWRQTPEVVVLNDDRVIVRPAEQNFMLEGTPWHGDGYVCANAAAPLKAIFSLRHGRMNIFKPLEGARAVAEIYAAGVLPLYDLEAMERAYETCLRLIESFPILIYEFVPDALAVHDAQQFLLAEGIVSLQG